MDELNEKVDLIKKKIEDAKKAGDAGYAKSLESYLNVTQSSLNSIQGWYSSLNEIFGIIGFGIAVGIYSVYLSEKFVVSLLMSIGAFIILLFKSAEVGRRLPLFKRGG
ncbi:hypothetical protein [Thiomonas sp.]|uniref:hypothetical protein n=1 Tax=Thiomonas sp. TaxID=2047785 RepID=UPI00261852F1|nr:hypothetical protein [Thiomonas sp.]